MKKLPKRISRHLRLGIDLAAVLLLLFLIWAFLDYPCFTAKQAFRRGLKNAAYPDAEMEVLVKDQKNTGCYYGIGANDTFAYRVRLSNDIGWKPEFFSCCASQSAQTVWCVRIPWKLSYKCYLNNDGPYYAVETNSSKLYDASTDEELIIQCFAVKAPGSTASLTLVLDDGEYCDWFTNEKKYSSRTEWPLPLQETSNGWFIFRFNTKEIYEEAQKEEHFQSGQFNEPYHSYFSWIELYNNPYNILISNPEYCPPAHLELTTYNEDGTPLRTESWPLLGE